MIIMNIVLLGRGPLRSTDGRGWGVGGWVANEVLHFRSSDRVKEVSP